VIAALFAPTVAACGSEGPGPERTREAVGGGLTVATGGAGGEGETE
jgi:hypothetical protein